MTRPYPLLIALILLNACGPNKKPDEVIGKPPEDEQPYTKMRSPKTIQLYTHGQPKDAREHQQMVDRALSERAQALGACLGDPNSEFHGETLAMRVSFELSWRGELSKLSLGELPVESEDPLVPCLVDVLQKTTMPYHPDKISTTHKLQIKVSR